MALTKNNIQKAENATSMSYTPSSVANASLLVWVVWEDVDSPHATISDVDFGGTSLTKIRGEIGSDGFFENNIEVWYLKSPGTSTQTITVTGLTGINGAAIVAMTVGGADGTTFVEAHDGLGGTGSLASVSVTSLTADALVMAMYNGNAATPTLTTGQTVDSSIVYSTGDAELASTIRATAGTETFEWDPHSSRRALIAIAIKPSAGGGTSTLSPANGIHGHVAHAASFVQVHDFGIAPALHGHTADAGSFTQLHELAPALALHGQVADQVSFVPGGSLAIGDGAHGHGADGVTFGQGHALGSQSAASAHMASIASFITQSEIVIADAHHDHESEDVIFGAGLVPPPERRVQSNRAARVIEPGPAPRIIQGKR